jgi:hypothetical protein
LVHGRRHNPHHGAYPATASRGLIYTSPKNRRTAADERECLKLPASDLINQHGADPPPGPSEDVACAIEQRAPSGKRRRGGREDEQTNNRSGLHTPGVGSSSDHQTALAGEMPSVRRRPLNMEPPSTCREPVASTRSSCHQAADVEGGGGEVATNTRTGRHTPRTGRQRQIWPPPCCSLRRTPRAPHHEGTPLQPSRPPCEGWMRAPPPPSSLTPRVVPVVGSGGSAARGIVRGSGR